MKLSKEESETLLKTLQTRFEKHMHRHKGVAWADILKKIQLSEAAMKTLYAMEETGGEPDVIAFDKKTGEITFCDCSPESPKGRRSICYDHQALESRKEHKPENSAIQMASEIGITILNEEQYRYLQSLDTFDTKTSSWILTPPAIRKLGGAVFCDYRYGTVFLYHNGAESYYAARGFRGLLKV